MTAPRSHSGADLPAQGPIRPATGCGGSRPQAGRMVRVFETSVGSGLIMQRPNRVTLPKCSFANIGPQDRSETAPRADLRLCPKPVRRQDTSREFGIMDLREEA